MAKNARRQELNTQGKLKLYEEFCRYASMGSFNAEKIKEFIRKGVSISHPSEKEERNTLLRCIIRGAKTEREAIELLQLIYDRDKLLFREQDTKGMDSLIYVAILDNQKQLFDFLVNTVQLPIDSIGRLGGTPLYAIVTSGGIFNEEEWILRVVKLGADPYLVSARDGKCPFELIKSKELQEAVAKERIRFKENQIIQQKQAKQILPAYFSSFCLDFCSSSKTDPNGYSRLPPEEPEAKLEKQTKFKKD